MLDDAPHTRLETHEPVSRDHLGCYGNSSRSGWIVATTHPQAEFWAEANLQRRGYPVFLPLYATKRRDGRTTHTTSILLPLFSNYLFVRYNSTEPRRPIRETPGVRDVIRCGAEVQWVNAGAVEALQASEPARRCLTAQNASWAPGTPCSLDAGPFAGLPAVVTHLSTETANIAIMFLGHLRNVSVPLDCLKARDDS
jgi:transcription antitermination factor NusG